MTSKFFKFTYNVPADDDYVTPWAMSVTAPLVRVQPPVACDHCGARPMEYNGPGLVDRVGGSHWADIIGSGSSGPRYIVSERVVQGLFRLRATGFIAHRVSIHTASERLASLPIPKYFYLAIKGTMRIDWERSGLHEPCSVCGAPVKAQIKSPDRIYPVEDTWDGSDLFRGRPYGGPYCTLRVLLLAREERWTNFRFYPIDESHEVQVYSEGIDYLGDQWPPTWCADRPSAGKALNEWLDDFFSLGETPEDYKRYMAAMRALDDLGAEALPPLIERFNAGSLKAANGILSIAQRGTTVSPDLLDRAEQAVWAEDSKHNPHLFEKDENGKLRYRDLS